MDIVMWGTYENAESAGRSIRIVIQSPDDVTSNSAINISHVSY
jgi:hypothetical protein